MDADLPLTYKFVYQVGDSGSTTPVADAQSSSSYSCILPQGHSEDNYTVTTIAYVYDSYNANTEATDSVRVLPVKYTVQQLSNVSAALAKNALESKDPETCLQVLGATHKSLSSGGSTSSSRRHLLVSDTTSAIRADMLASLKVAV